VAAVIPSAVTTAQIGATNARATMKGPKMIAVTPITASVLARTAQAFVTGGEAMRSGASSPEIASQARLPANFPADGKVSPVMPPGRSRSSRFWVEGALQSPGVG
jgi:hypothetical protein